MARLVWDKQGEHFYETGVDRGVLYPWSNSTQNYDHGVAWNGLTAVTVSPSGADPNPIYADNIKYLNLYSAEEFGATIEAYTYPDEWAECDGSAQAAAGVTLAQQPRKMFGFSFRSLIGNDTVSNDYGYNIHLIYKAQASPSDKNYQTVNDNPEPADFSWEVSTTPTEVGGNYKPTAHIVINSVKVNATLLASFEDILYGKDNTQATLPSPADVISHFSTNNG